MTNVQKVVSSIIFFSSVFSLALSKRCELEGVPKDGGIYSFIFDSLKSGKGKKMLDLAHSALICLEAQMEPLYFLMYAENYRNFAENIDEIVLLSKQYKNFEFQYI